MMFCLINFWGCFNQRTSSDATSSMNISPETNRTWDISAEVLEWNIAQGIEILSGWQSTHFFETYLALLEQTDHTCPLLFPSVQQMQAWNDDCVSENGWQFEGRAQLVYLENQEWEGAWYQHIGSFINDATIQSPDFGLFKSQGFGELRIADGFYYAQMTGWFEMGPSEYWDELSWMDGSLSFLKEADVENHWLKIQGGISQSTIFDNAIVAVEFVETVFNLEESCVVEQGQLKIVHQNGDRILLDLVGNCENCILFDADERQDALCWDLTSFADQRW